MSFINVAVLQWVIVKPYSVVRTALSCVHQRDQPAAVRAALQARTQLFVCTLRTKDWNVHTVFLPERTALRFEGEVMETIYVKLEKPSVNSRKRLKTSDPPLTLSWFHSPEKSTLLHQTQQTIVEVKPAPMRLTQDSFHTWPRGMWYPNSGSGCGHLLAFNLMILHSSIQPLWG